MVKKKLIHQPYSEIWFPSCYLEKIALSSVNDQDNAKRREKRNLQAHILLKLDEQLNIILLNKLIYLHL